MEIQKLIIYCCVCLFLSLKVLPFVIVWFEEKNKSKDDRIAAKLLETGFFENWLLVAQNNGISKKYLIKCARKTASIYEEETNERVSFFVDRLSSSLLKHPKVTTKVPEILMSSSYYRVWDNIATANCMNESLLKKLALKCANISNSPDYALKIAKKLIDNPKSTDLVYCELFSSEYEEVRKLAFEALGMSPPE